MTKADVLRDVKFPEDLFRMQLIVRAAKYAEIRRVVGPAERARLHMVELEESTRGTSFAAFVDESTLLSIPLEYLPSYASRNRAGFPCVLRDIDLPFLRARRLAPRSRRPRESLALEPIE